MGLFPPGNPDERGPLSQPRPSEALGLLALSATLFWGGAILLGDQPPAFLHSVLPLASFLGPALAWAEIRGVERQTFPSARVSPRVLAGAFGVIAGASLLALVLAALASYLPGAVREQETMRSFLMEVPIAWRFLLFAILPALCEEALFRGALLACLRSWGGVRACFASGLAFAAFHASPVRLLPVLLLGTALAAVVWVTGNLWIAVAGHAAHNAVVLWGMELGKGDLSVGGGVLSLMAAAGLLLLAAGVWLRPRGGLREADAGPVGRES